jgi:phosphoglycolate phosphatase-like HAD superfamily hydrolase
MAEHRETPAEAALLHFAAEAHRRKWSFTESSPEAFDALHLIGNEMRAAVDEARKAPAAPPVAADLTPAQCEALRRMTEEWGDALGAVRSAVDLLGARIHSAEDARVIAGAREALKVLEGAEADSAAADPRSPAPAAAEPAVTATRPAEAIRIRMARALYDSLDRCARCKVCEHQCGAAADVAVEAVSAERERAEAAEAKLAAGDALIRDILEALCLRDGLSLESGITPGEPARNYELALRLGIGHVFGIKEAGDGLEARP